ncbi:PIN domain-containing protein [Candidatus Microgenomates bacterium]|nr:PIN domain-containing protein [Candidatus Microgenomates bacterium]
MIFIDSNVIIRFVLNDNPKLSAKSYQILKQIENGAKVYLAPIILAEIVYVLLKVYKLGKTEIKNKVLPVVMMENINMEKKDILPRAFEFFVSKNVDFEDAYLAALMEKKQIKKLYSFDEDFDKFPQIERLEG